MNFTCEKFNGTEEVGPAVNAVVSYGKFPETLMRECSPEIETFLHLGTSFWSISRGLRKISELPLYFEQSRKFVAGLYRYVLKRIIQCNKTLAFLKARILQ